MRSMELVSADPVLPLAYHMKREKPLRERYLAVFKDRANQDRELFSTFRAFPDTTVAHLPRARFAVALLGFQVPTGCATSYSSSNEPMTDAPSEEWGTPGPFSSLT